MGMYNEVTAPCPECKERVQIQIPQVVLGFGEFHVDKPETMEDLSNENKKQLIGYVEERVFYCDTHGAFEISLKLKERKLRPEFDF